MLHYPNTTSFKQAISNKKREEFITKRKHIVVKTKQYTNIGLETIDCYSLQMLHEVTQ